MPKNSRKQLKAFADAVEVAGGTIQERKGTLRVFGPKGIATIAGYDQNRAAVVSMVRRQTGLNIAL